MKLKRGKKRLIKVPFYKQRTSYTCGPATIKMMLKFFGVKKSERSLVKEAGTNSDIGTNHRELINMARNGGLYCYVQEMSSVHIIKHFISRELPVIINYVEPSTEEGHYAIVVGYKKGGVVMNDPWNGKNFYLKYKDLYTRWNGGKFNNSKKWIMVLSRKPIITGEQFNPLEKQ